MLTAREVAQALKDWNDYNYSDFWSAIDELDQNVEINNINLSLVKFVGGEGQGDVAYLVVQANDQFFRKDGYYASYDGFTWDGDFYEVTPQEKTIVVYEDVVSTNVFDAYDSLDSFDEGSFG